MKQATELLHSQGKNVTQRNLERVIDAVSANHNEKYNNTKASQTNRQNARDAYAMVHAVENKMGVSFGRLSMIMNEFGHKVGGNPDDPTSGHLEMNEREFTKFKRKFGTVNNLSGSIDKLFKDKKFVKK